MTAPAPTTSIADTPARRQWRSDRLQHKIRLHSLDFIHEAFRLWRFDHDQLWREQGAESFDAWVNTPANRQHSPSRAHLQVQIIETCWYYFGVDRVHLYEIGYRKLQIIMPEIEEIRRMIPSFEVAKRLAMGWIFAAHTNTVVQLESLMLEQSLRYADKNASTPLNGGNSGGFEVLCPRQPFDVDWLRGMSASDLLGVLGLSDIKGQVYIQVVKPKGGDNDQL